MERKIGEIFTDNGVELRVEKALSCMGCYGIGRGCVSYHIAGACYEKERTDKQGVIFTEVTKTE